MKHKYLFLFLFLLLANANVNAQRKDPIGIARAYISLGKVDSALMVYQYAYEEEPYNQKLYDEYLSLLIKEKKYDKADELVKYMSQIKREDVGIIMDQVQIYELKGESKKAKEITNEMISSTASKGEYDVRKAIGILESKQKYNEAIAILERVNEKKGDVIDVFSAMDNSLAKLYIITGDLEKAIPLYMEQWGYNPEVEAEFKSRLLTLIEQDKKNIDKTKSILSKSLKDRSIKNTHYGEIVSWLDNISGKQNNAIETMIALDKKAVNSQSDAIYQLGLKASYDGQYQEAMNAFDYLINTIKDNDKQLLYAHNEYFKNAIYKIHHKRPVDMALVNATVDRMDRFYSQFPDQRVDAIYLSYTDLVAKYQMQPEKAIGYINAVIDSLRPNKQYLGYAKLALGDYHLFKGKVWDANLYYAQVDKLFRQDMIGEEARYKQAKVAFYRGDFEWAQQALNILKSSTTELISNDAMQLSIVITENTSQDTASLPLKEYAKADLMIYQQQYDSAKTILADFLTSFPEHDLVDDVLSLSGNIALEEGDYALAIKYYQEIIAKYKDDVLADDATLKIANIYNDHLKDKEKAKIYYENLIIDYPQSTLVAIARAKLQAMNKDN